MNTRSNKKLVLLIISSEKCSYCKTYKKEHRDTVIANLKDEVNIIEHDSPDFIFRVKPEYHPDVARFQKWWPMFILFDESWYDHKSKLNGVILGGEFKNGIPTTLRSFTYEAAGVVRLVREKINDPSWRTAKGETGIGGGVGGPQPILVNSAGVPIAVPQGLQTPKPKPNSLVIPSPVTTQPNTKFNLLAQKGYVPTSGSIKFVNYDQDDD